MQETARLVAEAEARYKMDVGTKLPPKRDVMMALLQQAESVYVHFDPRPEGVILPPQLRHGPRVVLQYGLNMRIPIPDLDVGNDGIGATLSFDRKPCWTFIPWSAVFIVVTNDQRAGMLWEADVPPEVELEQKRGAPADKRPAPKPAPATQATKGGAARDATRPSEAGKRPVLRAVDGGKDVAPPEPVAIGKRSGGEPPAQRPEDDIVEPPEPTPKKKRELPPYLRVVK